MAGIYLHIPWCRKVCIYCDFHFSVSIRNKAELLECMIKELELQKNYTGREVIETVYFGGGTPSVVNAGELRRIFDKISSEFNLSANPEITLEANPDDLSPSYLRELFDMGINRLSIGIQSFIDDDLKWMNRRHNKKQSVECIESSRNAGFKNISIDLIYGLPSMSMQNWINNLEIAFKSNITHLSAYHLTLENKTVYSHRVKKGLLQEPDEEAGREQFEMLMDMAQKEGFVHYEISNFCLPDHFSRHNLSYWQHKPYLGIGPSANSFDGDSRQWNVRNNSLYIKKINEGVVPCEIEQLDIVKSYNEYVMTSLRTIWGADKHEIEKRFGRELLDYFCKESQLFIEQGKLEQSGNSIIIGRSGKFFADGIISSLFMTR